MKNSSEETSFLKSNNMKSFLNLFRKQKLPKVGDLVYVKLPRMHELKPKAFIAYIPGAVFPYVVASLENYEEFKSGNRLSVTAYKEIIIPKDSQ